MREKERMRQRQGNREKERREKREEEKKRAREHIERETERKREERGTLAPKETTREKKIGFFKTDIQRERQRGRMLVQDREREIESIVKTEI
eukprot:538221-Amorphochlora_amoeboformis.AAC.1